MNAESRLNYLTFVTVALAVFAGFVAALFAAIAVRDPSGDTGAVGDFASVLPAVAGAAGWAIVNQQAAGRKMWGVVAVFCGSMAALIFLVPFGPIGLVGAMGASGTFGVAARRLLDAPHAS